MLQSTSRLEIQIALRFAVVMAVMLACLFALAGRWDLPMFWAVFAIWFGIGLAGLLLVARKDATLLQERFKPGPGGRDPLTRKVAAGLGLASLAVAALDVGRYHWSDTVPRPLQVAGLLIVGLTMGVWMWAMWVNRFFSSEVRIQRDRGHHLITEGPYRVLRHPGYAAALLLFASVPLALGSWWALAPMGGVLLALLRRTWLEDSVLRAELEGYAEYAGRVRYRLLPGVW